MQNDNYRCPVYNNLILDDESFELEECSDVIEIKTTD